MRKDYIPVDATTGALDETAFVERYWTDRWRDRDKTPDVSAIVTKEEYRLMRFGLDRLERGSRILDGGCGLGEWTLALAREGFDVTGLDLSESTVARLNTLFPDSSFKVGDLRRTGFADGAFDAYFSWGAFEHFECGLGECVEEANRILRPGGWLFVSVPFHNWRLMLRDAIGLERGDGEVVGPDGGLTPHRFYQWRLTRQELRRELELRGFSVHSVSPIAKLTGVGRMLQWDLPVFARGSIGYRLAARALALTMPSAFVSHMILAVAQRR